MNGERTDRMRARMQEEGIDALVLRLPENLLLLSGYWPMCGWVYLVFPVESGPFCVIPSTEETDAQALLWEATPVSYRFGTVDSAYQDDEIRKALQEIARGKNWKSIGYEGGFGKVPPAWNTAEVYIPSNRSLSMLGNVFGEDALVDCSGIIDLERARKTEYELEKIRIANEVANIGLERFLTGAAPGRSGVELAADVEYAVVLGGTGRNGARRVRAFAQVSTGKDETAEAAKPMVISSRRRILDNDPVLLELAVVADGYWSDRTRTAFANSPDPVGQRISDVVFEAQKAALAAIAPGIKAKEVDEAARAVIRNAGFGKQFTHPVGHGVGFCYHESIPDIGPKNSEPLQQGMVFSVEPGIYIPGVGGFRTEDDVVVNENGFEILAPFPVQ